MSPIQYESSSSSFHVSYSISLSYCCVTIFNNFLTIYLLENWYAKFLDIDTVPFKG